MRAAENLYKPRDHEATGNEHGPVGDVETCRQCPS